VTTIRLTHAGGVVRRDDVRQRLLAATTPEAFIQSIVDAESR
jgi:hypothetical protein